MEEKQSLLLMTGNHILVCFMCHSVSHQELNKQQSITHNFSAPQLLTSL